MNRFIVSVLVATFACTGCATATAQEARPVAGISHESSLEEILDALDRRGRDMQSLRADVKLTETDTALNDSTARSGTFVLQNRPDGSPRAHVVFDRKMIDDRKIAEKIEYMLDNGVVVDRNYNKTTQVTREVLRPGERMNLLKLGEGPFPLPIGQKREDVLKQFDVTKVEPAKDDPPGTVHLRLIPKPKTSLARKFKSIDTWVNTSDELPSRISTLDISGTTERSTDLSKVQINAPVADADFTLEKIDTSKWNLVEEPLRDPGR